MNTKAVITIPGLQPLNVVQPQGVQMQQQPNARQTTAQLTKM